MRALPVFEPVRRIIVWGPLATVARLALASPFIVSGVAKIAHFDGAMEEMRAFGLAPPALFAALVIATQLGGSALFLTRRFCWLGAGLLAGFTALATLLAHAFWTVDAADRMPQMMTFFEHVAIVGGFIAATILINGRSPPP